MCILLRFNCKSEVEIFWELRKKIIRSILIKKNRYEEEILFSSFHWFLYRFWNFISFFKKLFYVEQTFFKTWFKSLKKENNIVTLWCWYDKVAGHYWKCFFVCCLLKGEWNLYGVEIFTIILKKQIIWKCKYAVCFKFNRLLLYRKNNFCKLENKRKKEKKVTLSREDRMEPLAEN